MISERKKPFFFFLIKAGRKKPCGPKMIVLARIPQAQSSRIEQRTSKVDGRTSNMATGTEPKVVTLLSLNLFVFFLPILATLNQPLSQSHSHTLRFRFWTLTWNFFVISLKKIWIIYLFIYCYDSFFNYKIVGFPLQNHSTQGVW